MSNYNRKKVKRMLHACLIVFIATIFLLLIKSIGEVYFYTKISTIADQAIRPTEKIRLGSNKRYLINLELTKINQKIERHTYLDIIAQYDNILYLTQIAKIHGRNKHLKYYYRKEIADTIIKSSEYGKTKARIFSFCPLHNISFEFYSVDGNLAYFNDLMPFCFEVSKTQQGSISYRVTRKKVDVVMILKNGQWVIDQHLVKKYEENSSGISNNTKLARKYRPLTDKFFSPDPEKWGLRLDQMLKINDIENLNEDLKVSKKQSDSNSVMKNIWNKVFLASALERSVI